MDRNHIAKAKSRVLAYTGFCFVSKWTYLTSWLRLFYTKSSVMLILYLKPVAHKLSLV